MKEFHLPHLLVGVHHAAKNNRIARIRNSVNSQECKQKESMSSG